MTRHQKRKIDETHVEVCCRHLYSLYFYYFNSKCYVMIYYLSGSWDISFWCIWWGKKTFPAHLTSISLVARTWGAWCSQLEGTWRIHKGEKYCEDRTWEIWDRYMVFLSFSTRVQWLPEAVFLWILPQLREAQRTASEAHGELYLLVLCTLPICQMHASTMRSKLL